MLVLRLRAACFECCGGPDSESTLTTPHRDVPFTKIDQEGKKIVTKVEKNYQELSGEQTRTPPHPHHTSSRNARESIDTAVPRRIPRILPHEEHVNPSHGPLVKDGSGAIGAFRGPSHRPRRRRRRRREALVRRASLGDPTPTYRVQRQHLLRRATARVSSLPGTWAAAHGPGE